MEFEIQYNNIVNKNKNLFYFENYCVDYKEFKDWLKYNHNTVSIKEFENLDEQKRSIYLEIKRDYITSNFKIYRIEHHNIGQKKYDDITKSQLRKYLLAEMYKFYLDNKYYVELTKDIDKFINKTYEFINENYYNLGRVIISDIYGKIIYDENILNDNELSLDMNNFSNGMYAVKIINGNLINNSKFIKIN